HLEAPARTRVGQLVIERALGRLVGLRHEIGRALLRDLQMLDLAEIAAQLRAGLARGAFHDGDDAGYGHCSSFQHVAPAKAGGRCRQSKTLAAPAFAGATLFNQSARRTYSRSYTCTTIFVPLVMCGGTITRTPLSRIA